MLWTIVVILLLLWALGLVTSYTLGGLIHVLLLLAIIVVVVRMFVRIMVCVLQCFVGNPQFTPKRFEIRPKGVESG